MRRSLLGWSLLGSLMIVSCGDSASDAGGSGGTGGSTNEGAGTSDGGNGAGVSDGGSAGSPEGGGPPGCIEVESAPDLYPVNPLQIFTEYYEHYFSGAIEPSIGAAEVDYLDLLLTADATGSISLTLPANVDDCLATTSCVIVYEDNDADGYARAYAATSGTIELGTSSPPYYIAGSLQDVVLVEVVSEEGAISVVEGGVCAHITELTFDIQPPTADWSCNPNFYQDGEGCDCACGDPDPDCEDPEQVVYGCKNETDICVEGVCTSAT